MIQQGSGHIVNTASLAGLLPSPGLTPYAMTKYAVVGLSLSLRAEAAAYGVKVTAVCPGFVDTPILDKGGPDDLPKPANSEHWREMAQHYQPRLYRADRLAQDIVRGWTATPRWLSRQPTPGWRGGCGGLHRWWSTGWPDASWPGSAPRSPPRPPNWPAQAAPASPPREEAALAMTELGAAATMCEAFQQTVAQHPQQVALRTPGGAVTITWEEYAGRVRQIAAGLAGLGVRRGDTVALMMTNRPEFHLADTAAFHVGAAPFSVYNTFALEQMTEVLGDAGSRVVICEEQFAPRLMAAPPEKNQPASVARAVAGSCAPRPALSLKSCRRWPAKRSTWKSGPRGPGSWTATTSTCLPAAGAAATGWCRGRSGAAGSSGSCATDVAAGVCGGSCCS